MARILITSGPTRQYLDPVRYLSNASSGRMGCALAAAALEAAHEVTIVSGPVAVEYPAAARVVNVVSTEEMLTACQEVFASCDGVIAAAAPCDFRPQAVAGSKIQKTGDPLPLQLVETPDILASLAARRSHQWLVGFALETDAPRQRAMEKLRNKGCDLMVLNGVEAIDAPTTNVQVIHRDGHITHELQGSKDQVARALIQYIEEQLIVPAGRHST